MPGHFCTAKVFTPSSAIDDSILFCRMRIAVMTTMIEKTPTITPRSVSAERSLCAATAFSAITQLSLSSARHILFAPQGVHRVHSRRAPGGKKSRHNACDQRHENRDADNLQRHMGRHKSVDQACERPCDREPNQSTKQTNRRGFGEELDQNRAPFRADGFANPDLAGSFRDGHEHDVHNANAADKE